MKKMRMTIVTAVIITIVILITIFISPSRLSQNSEDNKLIVSILPLKYLVEQIVGNDYHVEVLVPKGLSPETYEPTPQQLIAISNAELLFTTGLIDFECKLMEKITKDTSIEIVNLSKSITLLSGCCGGSITNHHKHHHSGIDPHIWTSPKCLKIMAENAYQAIALLSPNNEIYEKNYLDLIAELDQLDATINKMLQDVKLKYFFIYHPAMTYYARDYNIQQVSIETEGKEPSADQLLNLINIAKTENIKTVLYQREFNKSVVETIAKDIGAIPVEIDPLAENIIESIIQITQCITNVN